MKRSPFPGKLRILTGLTILVIINVNVLNAQQATFKFAFISDTHIQEANGTADEDLRRTVRDINSMPEVAFVVLTGDITELGTDRELQQARLILDSLRVPFHILPGNHDTGWSESGGQAFKNIFGYDKFAFDFGGYRFLGCASGPYVRMSDGHIPRDAIVWLDSVLQHTGKTQPIFFLNHYPIDNSLDNWYEITDRLREFNTQAILCGHGHRNKAMEFEGIAGVMSRSNLRARNSYGGYNLVEVRQDSAFFYERTPGVKTHPAWTSIALGTHRYDQNAEFDRPSFEINTEYKVAEVWRYESGANVISTPVVTEGKVIFGNQNGDITALSYERGEYLWTYRTRGSVFSSPAEFEGKVVFGSADGNIYCLTTKGVLLWRVSTGGAVLGSPIIDPRKQRVFIGGSDGRFRCIDLKTGKLLWEFNGISGPVLSKPLATKDMVIFGAWDTNLYALDKKTGTLKWKWNNGKAVRHYSPAACIPVEHNGVVYIVAPDRYISAIDSKTGKTLWRNNDTSIRESIGISEGGRWVYGKTMQDTLVAYPTSREKQDCQWKLNCGFGYEHAPSMIIEKEGHVFFGTKNGIVYAVDPIERKLVSAHKIDNSMVNTVNVTTRNQAVVATMDGKVVLLQFEF